MGDYAGLSADAVAIIVVLVVSGVAISTFAIGPDATAKPAPPVVPDAAPAKTQPQTRDIGIGPDEDPFDYEARIDKLLSEVEKQERKEPKRERRPSQSKPEVFPDRI